MSPHSMGRFWIAVPLGPHDTPHRHLQHIQVLTPPTPFLQFEPVAVASQVVSRGAPFSVTTRTSAAGVS
jgi:hypothetical protein